ncbi:hypothetical protein BJY52DRAFT_567169 [Lactarius psammicola]|nr:hypothetical protein BJY52DRAFT_567169 [Lactarius psammicola]
MRRFRRRNNSQGADLEARPQDEEDHEMSTRTSTRLQAQAPKDRPSNSGDNTAQPMPPEVSPRMIGDFDDNANSMWSLHMKEAKSHDEARIQSLKEDMDGVLIFAGLFSASLTSFIIDKIHDLRVDPTQQLVYYQQQNVALLAQISNQVSSIAPQVSIPFTPPLPFPNFTPKSSDVRVNAFWFMSLVFSLSAALLATLVQQWARDYMHVFQRYSNPLKSARLRQYLYEGVEGWYMPLVAESVPGLVHVSLFLFFLGLGDSLLALNTTIAITTIVPITVCGLLYVFSTFTPILNPQSPYQTPFSRVIWYLMQKVHPRSYSDRASGGGRKTVSSHMSKGRVQLAMEENEERKGRDVRAIRWLIDNSTEDDEMESFAMAIPGAFTSKWGIEVWREVSEPKQYEDTNPIRNNATVKSQTDADFRESIPPHHGSPLRQRTFHPRTLLRLFGRILGLRTASGISRGMTVAQSIPYAPNDPHAAINDLCERVGHLVDTCNNRSLFANKELWRKRARGCVETVASLVIYADIKLERFGDLGRLLREQVNFEKILELSAAGFDGSFVTCWICLSLVVVTRGISDHGTIKEHARSIIDSLSRFRVEDDSKQTNNGDADEMALKNARKIDNYFDSASQFCVYGLSGAFSSGQVRRTEEQVREVLKREHKVDISRLENVGTAAGQMEGIDMSVSDVNDTIRLVSHGLSKHLPGVSFDESRGTEPIQPIQFFNLSVAEGQVGQPFTPQFVFLGQRLRLLCSYAPKLRDIINGQGNGVCQEIFTAVSITIVRCLRQNTQAGLESVCDHSCRSFFRKYLYLFN